MLDKLVEILNNNESDNEKILSDLFRYLLEKNFIQKEIHELLENIVHFSDTIVREIMTPRTEVVAVKENINLTELKKVFKEHKFSRIPVFKDNVDNIVGIIHSKDLIVEDFSDIKKIMRRPYFVPETKKIVQLLKEFKDKKIKIGIVVDEYGGVSGIVTLMDILEEIIGDIDDESIENFPNKINKLDNNSYLVDSRTSIEDIRKEIELNLEEGPYDTIGGFVIKKFGRIPEKDEVIEVGNFKIIVNDVYEKGIKNLIIRKS